MSRIGAFLGGLASLLVLALVVLILALCVEVTAETIVAHAQEKPPLAAGLEPGHRRRAGRRGVCRRQRLRHGRVDVGQHHVARRHRVLAGVLPR